MLDKTARNLAKRRSFAGEALPHMEALLRTALRLTKNQSDAEDLVQEAYAKAYRFWAKFEPGSNCRAWLFKIMTNIFINNYRSKSRSPMTANLDDIDDNFIYGRLAGSDRDGNPERELLAKLFDKDIRNAIESLPDDFRLVAVLSFLDGFSYQEIADIAGLRLGTVKSRLHRGRKMLQAGLFDYAVRNGYVKDGAIAE